MNKVINGKMYNTESAVCHGVVGLPDVNVVPASGEALYQKATKEYFLRAFTLKLNLVVKKPQKFGPKKT